jgi:hypothetical protein
LTKRENGAPRGGIPSPSCVLLILSSATRITPLIGVCLSSKWDEAHRKKQGEDVVTYVEPLLRSNDVSRR